MRIVSICPSNTELAACLGLTSQLAGIDDFSDWPGDIQNLPKLGPDLAIRMDDLETCKPDLVLASLSVPGMEKNIEELEKRNIPHLVFNPQSLEDIHADLIKLGKATGTEEKAIEKAEQYRSLMGRFKTKAAELDRKPSVYFEWWPKPVFTPGGTNWLTEVSRLAGAENIFASEKIPSVQTVWEEVLDRDPEFFFMVWVGVKEAKMNAAHVKKRPGSNQLTALKRNQVILLKEALFCRPSPRLYEGLANLAQIVHPDHFSEEIQAVKDFNT
ncbi:ABC transporter substrate-binding protein [Bacillus mangrovi]|uniref:ABC transporter substrate-binding protein n=1 Tax=Metabacillus mangrovi TaxID=1491830 RepID=A0A7X2S5X9_9BACI|nr:cobalamin-binding protein [Metabacillus mangrovi]MTH53845.1 ABC transporter substrate-binding protein [Metabacillus mangrovi]